MCGWWKSGPADAGGRGVLCRGCAQAVRRGGEVRLASGLLVRPLFVHAGAARRAVHAFKYQGVDRAAEVLGGVLAELLPEGAAARASGLPAADVLRVSAVHRSQLRRRRSEGLRFRLAGKPPEGSVLVDDALTTGAALTAAASACGGGGYPHQRARPQPPAGPR